MGHPPSTSTALCVLGMHRSGTSAVARVANLLGVDLGNNLLGGSTDNPRGFWEHREILAVHAELLESLDSFFDDFAPLPEGWHQRPTVQPFRDRLLQIVRRDFAGKALWGFKDPRTCRLLPLWLDILAEFGADGRYLLVVRNPDEIARSLAIRSGYSYNKSLLLTLSHMLESERHTRGRRRVIITFDEVMEDWSTGMAKVGTALSISWPNSVESVRSSVTEFLDPSLRHHAADRLTTAQQIVRMQHADADVARWTFEVYDALAAGGDDRRINAVAKEFQAALPRLCAWRQVRSIDQHFMKVEAWGVGLNAEVQRLARDNEHLRLELARRPAGSSPENQHPEIQALRMGADDAARELTILRQAIAEREATISRLETRLRELELARKWGRA